MAGIGLAVAQSGITDPNIGVRTIRRISDTIALYMPNSLSFGYAQGYSELRPGGTLTQGVLSGLSSIGDAWKSSSDEKIASMFKSSAPFLAAALASQFGDVGKILFTAGSGGKVRGASAGGGGAGVVGGGRVGRAGRHDHARRVAQGAAGGGGAGS